MIIDVDDYKFDKVTIRLPFSYKEYLKNRCGSQGISAYLRALIERDSLRTAQPRKEKTD